MVLYRLHDEAALTDFSRKRNVITHIIIYYNVNNIIIFIKIFAPAVICYKFWLTSAGVLLYNLILQGCLYVSTKLRISLRALLNRRPHRSPERQLRTRKRRGMKCSEPISPKSCIAKRNTASAREWLPQTAVRCLPAAEQRAESVCPIDHPVNSAAFRTTIFTLI